MKQTIRLQILIAIIFLLPSSSFSQAKPKKSDAKAVIAKAVVIPLDSAVKVGKLPNGFTYYIRKNVEPKNRVTLYLANKVGSILENDDQQGLAHFMEHMSFNGTKHFPKNELVSYLQKAGVRFGNDLNAYTSFDETVYQLPIPTDDAEILKNGFQIMRDWAQDATLDSVEIDKERGVILEEKRLGKSAQQRLQYKYLPVIFNQSRYSNRLPIGTEEVLKNFTPATIRNFHNDWYRPDLMAVIAVGEGHHPRFLAALEQLHREAAEGEADHPVHRVGLARAHQISELLDDDAVAEPRGDRPPEAVADPPLVALAGGAGDVAVAIAVVAGDAGAFGNDAHRVARRVGRLVLGEQRQQDVEIGRHFGDDCPVDLGEEAGEQSGLAAAPAEQLDHAIALVALDRGAQRVDRLDRAADCG